MDTPTTEPTVEAPPRRLATFRHVAGLSFRLLTPSGQYRDFDGGILSTDSDDPLFDWLLDTWAPNRPEIQVFYREEDKEEGHVIQFGHRVCDVCATPIADDDEYAEHVKEAHIDTGEQEESERPRRSRGRSRVVTGARTTHSDVG